MPHAPGNAPKSPAPAACRTRGISVCVDLVINHTAKEHRWAQAARKGDAENQDYYPVSYTHLTLPTSDLE